jgi:hypothetical protein
MSDETQVNFDEVLAQDGDAIEAFIKNIYSKSVSPPPQPVKDDFSYWKIAGLESGLLTLSALGGLILSAIRTGGLFYILEEAFVKEFGLGLFGNILSLISMIAALGAFELFVLVYGLIKGKKSGKTDVSGWGVIIAMVVIASASLFSSLSLASIPAEIRNTLNIIMGAISSLGSLAVVYFSSENFGFILNNVSAVRKKIRDNYKMDFQEWTNSAVAAYQSSSYNIRRKSSSKIYGGENQKVHQGTNEKKSEEKKTEDRPPSYYKEEIIKMLNSVYSKTGNVMRVKDIIDDLNVMYKTNLDYNRSKGFVSSLRKAWLEHYKIKENVPQTE